MKYLPRYACKRSEVLMDHGSRYLVPHSRGLVHGCILCLAECFRKDPLDTKGA